MLADQHLARGWSLSLFDQNGTVIATTSTASAEVLDSQTIAQLGRASGPGRTLVPYGSNLNDREYIATSTMSRVGWTVAVALTPSVALGPLHRAFVTLLFGGGTALSAMLLLAARVGRDIATPIAALADFSRAVCDGEVITPLPTGITEVDAVASSLAAAAANLHDRTTELNRTVGALRGSEGRLRSALEDRNALLERLVSTEEEERQRIARELHDRLGQYLTALSLGLASLECEPLTVRSTVLVSETREVTNEIGREVHRLAWELRPTMLDDAGLQQAAVAYVEAWSSRFGISVDYVGDLPGMRPAGPGEITLYRVLQEALTNVARHAVASRVSVLLTSVGRAVRLVIEDDGIGFTYREAAPQDGGEGFGLRNIRERLMLVGGTLQVETAPGAGTTLYCVVPIAA